MPPTPFTEATLKFLRQLKLHNDREWFQARKADYQENVLQPMQTMARLLNDHIARKAADYALPDPSKALNRIYRDVRFAADKSPYNTHVSALFTHRGLGKKMGAAAYFSLSGSEVMVAGGLYALDSPTLYKVRSYIAENHKALTKLLNDSKRKALLGDLQGDQLTRMPKGFPPDHPAGDLLRHKQWLLSHTWPAAFALESDFIEQITTRLTVLDRFLEFLNEPLLKAASNADEMG